MRSSRFIIPLALVGALAAGCILTSGQFSVSFDLPNPIQIPSPLSILALPIDLTTVKVYQDHKDKLKDVADLAILGEIKNNSSTATQVEFWLTPTISSTTLTAAQVRSTGTLLWGPFDLAANETTRIDWNRSAGLINGPGRDLLVTEIRGSADGTFTLYAIGPAGATTYNFTINDGVLVVVVDAGA
jgi:hypothetical protein